MTARRVLARVGMAILAMLASVCVGMWLQYARVNVGIVAMMSARAQAYGMVVHGDAIEVPSGMLRGARLCFRDDQTGVTSCRLWHEVEDFVSGNGIYSAIPRHERYPEGELFAR